MKLSTKPPVGTQDWDPAEFRRRQYLFGVWRTVCQRFGYEEYLTPLVEDKAIYEAKSGDEVGGVELTRITNKEGELTNLAIRPEMTPSVTRLVSSQYRQLPKPIRRFAIPNFYRNEKPQKGRNREFWQLNIDIFGSRDVAADIEMISMPIEIMRDLGAEYHMRSLKINDRRLIQSLLSTLAESSVHSAIARLMDKWMKRSSQENRQALSALNLSPDSITMICQWMDAKSIDECVAICPGIDETVVGELRAMVATITRQYPGAPVIFSPDIIRGFDYYDGVVFELVDNDPSFGRSLIGGGRYNGLGSIFGCDDLPAVGLGSGDEPMMIFLANRGLIPDFSLIDRYYVPYLDGVDEIQYRDLLSQLRSAGKNCLATFAIQKMQKIFADGEKRQCRWVVVYGENEVQSSVYLIKDLVTGEQTEHSL